MPITPEQRDTYLVQAGMTERDSQTVLYIAKSTEAITLCGILADLTREYEEEKRKAHERFQLETHQINDRYCGRVQRIYREYENRLSLLDVSDDDESDVDED